MSYSCLISGNGDRNRAVDGDIVVVEILPKSEWRARASRLVETETDRCRDIMTSIRVSGHEASTMSHFLD